MWTLTSLGSTCPYYSLVFAEGVEEITSDQKIWPKQPPTGQIHVFVTFTEREYDP